VIGDQTIYRVLLNLGANVNLLPFTVYERVGLGDLRPTKIVFQLAGGSTRLPRGVVEDVLIKMEEFIFPINFVVADT